MTGGTFIKAAAAATAIPVVVVLLLVMTVLGVPDQADSATADPDYAVSAEAKADIPSEYLALYINAAQDEGLDWAILAAIGKVETDHGRLKAPGVTSGVNSYGCCGGPMQFWIAPPHPNTWDSYGKDGNGDGKKNPHDPADAIPAAAGYLKASGAPGDYRRAIFAYNHATWYVEKVLAQATRYRGTSETLTTIPTIDTAGSDRLDALVAVADAIDKARIPYCYGGGHTTPAAPGRGQYCWHTGPDHKVYGSPDQGLDCSSAVSMLLQHAGYKLPTLTSTELETWGQSGPGKVVTIWTNKTHTYLQIGRKFWGTSQENYRHGPGWHTARTGTGFIARHPPGL